MLKLPKPLARMSPFHRTILAGIVSVAVLALMAHLIGLKATWNAVVQAGPGAFLVVGAQMAVLLLLQATAWLVLNRAIGLRVGFHTMLEATTVGLAGNMLTPSTYLGGEPVKVLYAGRRWPEAYSQLAATLLLAKYMELLSFVLSVGVVSLVTAVSLRGVLFTPPHVPLGVLLLVVGTLAFGASILLWRSLRRQRRPLTVIVTVLARLGMFARLMARLHRRVQRVERQASQVFLREGRTVWPVFLCYVLVHASIFVKPMAFFYVGWGISLHFAELGLFFLTKQLLLAFQLTPSGVGSLDGGLLAMLALAGIAITQPQCAAFLLCMRVWDAAVIIIGAYLAAHAGARLLSGPKKPLSDGPTLPDR